MNIKLTPKTFTELVTTVIKYLTLFLLLLVSVCVNATNNNEGIIIITPSQTKPYQTIVNSIKKEFINKKFQEKIKVLNLNILKKSPQRYLKGSKLVIPIGTKALDFYLKTNTKTPFVASFTTESAFSSLSSKAQAIIKKYFVGGVSLDQPSRRLAYLAKFIKPDVTSIGALLGPNSKIKNNDIRRQSAHVGSSINIVNIRTSDNPVSKLRNVFQKSQVFIVFPDKANFNRKLARWVIALSYKHQVPVVSYSKKYADAGALISLYSEPQQIGKQTAEIALAYLRHSSLPRKLAPPKYYNLAINRSVKQALNLSFPSKSELLRKLQGIPQ